MRSPEEIERLYQDLKVILNDRSQPTDEEDMGIAGALAALDWVRGITNPATMVLDQARRTVVQMRATSN